MATVCPVVCERFCASEKTELTFIRTANDFHGVLFKVTDTSGGLVFKVERSTISHKGKKNIILLRDGAGKPLLPMQPQEMSLHKRWTASRIESNYSKQQQVVFSVKKTYSKGSYSAEVVKNNKYTDRYIIQGFHSKSACSILRTPCGTVAAKMAPKFGSGSEKMAKDVWSVVVEEGFDQAFLIGVLVMLDRIA